MEYTVWERAKSRNHLSVKYMEERLGFYSYSDAAAAIRTDHLLAGFLRTKLEDCTSMLGEMLDALFELSIEVDFSRKVELLRDSVEVAGDEISVRDFEWKAPQSDALQRIVLNDRKLAEEATRMHIVLRHLVTAAYSVEKTRANDETLADSRLLHAIGHDIRKADEILEDIIFTFRERDIICNLKPLGFEKVFGLVRRGPRESRTGR